MKKGFFAGLFPKTAEKLVALIGVEDLNAIETEAQEVQNRLDAQATGNSQLKADFGLFETRLKALEDANTLSATTITGLDAKIEAVTAENAQLNTWKTNAQAAARTGAATDASNITQKADNFTASQKALFAAIGEGE